MTVRGDGRKTARGLGEQRIDLGEGKIERESEREGGEKGNKRWSE